MAKEVSDKVTKIQGTAVLKSVMPIGYYAHPAIKEDTTLRDIAYRLGEIAAARGYKDGEKFGYIISVLPKDK